MTLAACTRVINKQLFTIILSSDIQFKFYIVSVISLTCKL